MDWDVALKIWAVVGPLVAAAASAMWSRRNQVQDRLYATQQAALARESAIADGEREFKRNLQASKKAELKAALTQFVPAANHYLELCQANFQRGRDTASVAAELEAVTKVSAAYQVINVLGTDQLASLAKKVQNLATDYPIKVARESPERQEEFQKAYFAAKDALSREARRLLGLESEA